MRLNTAGLRKELHELYSETCQYGNGRLGRSDVLLVSNMNGSYAQAKDFS